MTFKSCQVVSDKRVEGDPTVWLFHCLLFHWLVLMPVCLFGYPFILLFTSVFICYFVFMSVYLFDHLPLYLLIFLSFCLFFHMFICPLVGLSILRLFCCQFVFSVVCLLIWFGLHSFSFALFWVGNNMFGLLLILLISNNGFEEKGK